MGVFTVNESESCCNASEKMFTLVYTNMMQAYETSTKLSVLRWCWCNFASSVFIRLAKTDLEKWRQSARLLINCLAFTPCSYMMPENPIQVIFCMCLRQTMATNSLFMSLLECCGKAWRMMSSKEEETLRFFQYVEENGLRAYNGLVSQNLDHARNERNRTFLQEKKDKKRKQEEAIKR